MKQMQGRNLILNYLKLDLLLVVEVGLQQKTTEKCVNLVKYLDIEEASPIQLL